MENKNASELLKISALLFALSGFVFGAFFKWYIGVLFVVSGLLMYIASNNFKIAEDASKKADGILETERLILRPWSEADADELYKYACDPQVGPMSGWPPHKDVEDSRNTIRDVLSDPETYAVVLKETGKPIGSIGLLFEGHGTLPLKPGELEIGFWLGVPYWGQGLIPEAVNEILRHCFEDLECTKVWCGYYNDNVKSKRVQEKCGFTYAYSQDNYHCKLMDEYRTIHMSSMTRDEWMRK